MTHSTDISTLARWMAADFSNQAQVFENPAFFAHIRVCMRPLNWEVLSGVSLFVEQAYDYMLNKPYRVRVLHLTTVRDKIHIENYTVKAEKDFYGASRDLPRLQTLTSDRLEKLSGCNMIVEWTGSQFKGTVEPGKGCIVIRDGQIVILKLMVKGSSAATEGEILKQMNIFGVLSLVLFTSCGGGILPKK
ncbi:MAG: hypothetical protein RLZZ86_2828 [Cyanobacteriota bacterium]